MTGAHVQPGWYPDPQGVMRWWDGYQWTQQVAPGPMAQQPYPPQPVNVQQPYRVVTREHKRTGHGLHLFLTIITGGLWGIVWIWQTVWHRSHKGEKTVAQVRY
jgi:hypothetical protein